LANQLVRSRFIEDFEEFAGKFKNLKPSLIATTLLATPKEIKKRYGIEIDSIEIPHYHDVLKAVNEGRISKDTIPEILGKIKKLELSETIGLTGKLDGLIKKKAVKASLQDIEKDIDRIIDENIEFVRSMGERALGPLIGKAMTQFKGRVDGNEISRIVRERLKKVK
ncbi:MAG: GatB/YqeY domain-containing protein, partial [Candidatus Altiarchaeota archaeon]|nr:GatB/YqeY domain-containing protein [Candidatus Altiarchaeota archaeon]